MSNCVDCGEMLRAYEAEADWCQSCCDLDLAKGYFVEQYTKRVDVLGLDAANIYEEHQKELETPEEVDEFLNWHIKKYDLTDLSAV